MRLLPREGKKLPGLSAALFCSAMICCHARYSKVLIVSGHGDYVPYLLQYSFHFLSQCGKFIAIFCSARIGTRDHKTQDGDAHVHFGE